MKRSLSHQRRAIWTALASAAGQVVRYSDLNRAIGMPEHADNGTLKVQVHHIRRLIRDTGSDILAARGEGYRLYRAPGAVFPWEDAR